MSEATAGFRNAGWTSENLPGDVRARVAPLRASDGAATNGFLYARGGEKTVVCIMHPREFLASHYLVPHILEAGCAAWTQASRMVGNDLRLEHEIVLLDVAAGLSLASGSGAWVYSPTDAGDPLGSMRQHGAMATAPTLHAGRDGRALCDVALSMRLFAADGAVLSSAETVIGQEVLPRLPAAKPWAEMPPADQAMVQTYCTAALRRGVLLAVRAAGVVQ